MKASSSSSLMLRDRFGRQITYLRISVTDRCNLRCVYCMPPEGVQQIGHDDVLRYEEIIQVVQLAAQYGVREVRLTGGEPLVRTDLPELVRMIAQVPGIEDISLTTNGLLLDRLAEPLARAGLKRINVSLDTLRPDRFVKITRGGSFERTWAGILKAEELNLRPIKLNVVMMRGVNDDELAEMALLTQERDWHVRFIELMPIQNQASWGEGLPLPEETYLPISEMMTRLEALGLEPCGHGIGSGPAQEYRLRGARGKVGFISPVSEPFCEQCNRLRLTADGNLRPCLLHDVEVPIRDALRRGEDLLPYLQQAIVLKPMAHELQQQHSPSGRCMRQIGG
jgi:cyclic pyranopterin phosphate synthase